MRKSNDNSIGKVTTILVVLSLLMGGCEFWPKPASLIPTPQVTTIPSTQVQPAGEVTTIPAEVTTTPSSVPPQVTTIPQFVVTSDVLEIRNGAGENFPNVGYLSKGDRVQVYTRLDTTGQACQAWAQISPDATRWVCADYFQPVNSGE